MVVSLQKLFEANPEICVTAAEYDICVATNAGHKANAAEVFAAFKEFPGDGKDTHLYIHIPLCEYVCSFCNYVKKKINSSNPGEEISRWVDLIIAESSLYLEEVPWVRKANIRSFYIGGGTGGILLSHEAEFRKLMQHFRSNYNFSDDCEFCIEGNPSNFTPDTLSLTEGLGFNRYSVGVQTLHEDVNGFARRNHSADDARRSIEALRNTGKPFNVDMMFGLPQQSVAAVEDDISELISLGVPSISIYRLRNSERELGNTSVWNKLGRNTDAQFNQSLPSVLAAYEQRRAMTRLLSAEGYFPSPCGWWSKPGTYPTGNIPRVSQDKWEKFNTMLGYGPGAYGWLSGGESKFIQFNNINDIAAYGDHMSAHGQVPPLGQGRILEGASAIGTKLTFAFKANQPIIFQEYKDRFSIDLMSDQPYANIVTMLIDKGFASMSADRGYIRPTPLGEEFHEEIVHHYFKVMLLDQGCGE